MKKLPLSVLILLGCTPAVEPDPGPHPDAGAPTCAGACAHWKELGCPEAEPTPEGATCVEVCLNLVSSGVIELNLSCRASVAKCADIDECEQ